MEKESSISGTVKITQSVSGVVERAGDTVHDIIEKFYNRVIELDPPTYNHAIKYFTELITKFEKKLGENDQLSENYIDTNIERALKTLNELINAGLEVGAIKEEEIPDKSMELLQKDYKTSKKPKKQIKLLDGDYHYIKWNGQPYHLTEAQADVVKYLHEQHKKGIKKVKHKKIIQFFQQDHGFEKIQTIFRNNEGKKIFGTLVKNVETGYYALDIELND